MDTMDKHTPTTTLEGMDYFSIRACIFHKTKSMDTAIKTTDLIFKTVNCHDELVEALKMLLNETNAGTWKCLPTDFAKQALAKAGA